MIIYAEKGVDFVSEKSNSTVYLHYVHVRFRVCSGI